MAIQSVGLLSKGRKGSAVSVAQLCPNVFNSRVHTQLSPLVSPPLAGNGVKVAWLARSWWLLSLHFKEILLHFTSPKNHPFLFQS